jgi:hypothetical protein
MYVASPSDSPGAFDFHPLAGKCTGAPVDESKFASDVDYALDFDARSKGTFTYRGAFAGGAAPPKDGGTNGNDTGGADGGVGPSGSGGGGCRQAPAPAHGFAAFAALVLAMVRRRRSRTAA